MKGYQIPFTGFPFQEKSPSAIKISEQQSLLVDQEISELLEKGDIQKAETAQDKFLSNLFLVGKKGRRNRPVINLKKLDSFIPYEHFKMEGLHYLKFLVQYRSQRRLLCNSSQPAVIKMCLIQVVKQPLRIFLYDNVYENLCLCFGLVPAPKVFTKLLKIPIALLR